MASRLERLKKMMEEEREKLSPEEKKRMAENIKNKVLSTKEDAMEFYELPGYKKPKKPPKSTRSKTISKKGYSNIMKARSDMTYENGKYKVDTKMNVNKKLNAKEKRTLIVNIIRQLNDLVDDYEFVFNEKN